MYVHELKKFMKLLCFILCTCMCTSKLGAPGCIQLETSLLYTMTIVAELLCDLVCVWGGVGVGVGVGGGVWVWVWVGVCGCGCVCVCGWMVG